MNNAKAGETSIRNRYDTHTILNRIPLNELSELVNEPISDEVACLDIEDASKGRPSDDQVMMLIKEKAGSIGEIDGNREEYDISYVMKQYLSRWFPRSSMFPVKR